MKIMTEKNGHKSAWELFAIAPIAVQLLRDIGHIYKVQIKPMVGVQCLPDQTSPVIEMQKGELVLVASRAKDLAEQLRLHVSLSMSHDLKQSVLLFGVLSSTAKYTQQLLELMADIETDSPIYDGQLSDQELRRVKASLVRLSNAKIYMAMGMMNRIDLQIELVRRQNEIERVGLVLVDSVQWLKDETSPTPNLERNLIRLKQLAVELDIPVLVLYRLDPTEDKHPSTLTRLELREAEGIAKLTDRYLLLSGTAKKLVLERPKIPNYQNNPLS
jgi:replicative DNA helicase